MFSWVENETSLGPVELLLGNYFKQECTSLKGNESNGIFLPFLQGRQFLWLPVCSAVHEDH